MYLLSSCCLAPSTQEKNREPLEYGTHALVHQPLNGFYYLAVTAKACICPFLDLH